MSKPTEHLSQSRVPSLISQEYEVLHEVAKALHGSQGVQGMLQKVLGVITQFEEIKVEKKAGIFLADESKKVLRLFCTIGKFSKEFLEKEKEVPYGECLCGRAAVSGEVLMSNSCFTDPRHERVYDDITAHGHYIVPLKSQDKLVGVMFLYTETNPSWYQHSQEVLLSMGGLIAEAMEHKRVEEELQQYRDQLEGFVEMRTAELTAANKQLQNEISERNKVEEQLRGSNEKLRNLGHKLQNMGEEMKTRIAREVHDELGQALTTLRMDILCMQRDFPEHDTALQDRINSQVNLIEGTIKAVQRICTDLRPQILDVFGICEAIAWQAGEYASRTGIQFDLNCLQENIKLDRDLTTAIFRIFQEITTNIVRHAQASNVIVRLTQAEDQIVLEVKDNGLGIQEHQINDPKSLGILGMRERVLFWNGEVHVQGSPGKGTTVTIKIPYKKP